MTGTRIPIALAPCLLGLATGCSGPGDRLDFPTEPLAATSELREYDVTGNGRVDFSIRADHGRLDVLCYDDDEDGRSDREFRLSQYDAADVPHLIILIDSIPFEPTMTRYAEAGWSWFDRPVKVIPPFPTMSGLIFSQMLGAPPPPGVINQYYNRSTGRHVNRIWQRIAGASNPWERRLHYRLGYIGNGSSFLHPRSWFAADLAMAKRAFDESPNRVTVVYLASAAGMLSQHGSEGLAECLDGIERLSLQLLYERNGAVKISVISDHGHNLRAGERIDLETMLKAAGFRPTSRLRDDRDVVIELDGLVNYFGLHCRRAAAVAEGLIQNPEIRLVIWQEGDRVLVRSAEGTAAIEQREGRYRYRAIDADVLRYGGVPQAMEESGTMDAEGFADADAWLQLTIDHEWPDAPPRLWEAFHGLVVNTPNVMVVTAAGYYSGAASFDRWIDMASTHGGLDQQDSAAVLLTMTGRAHGPLRTRDVLPTIEPEYDPSRLRRK